MKQSVVRVFDLNGFREYCEDNKFYRFIFSDENQCDYSTHIYVGYTSTFYNILIMPDSYRILIYNDNVDDVMYRQCYMSFDLVKRVEVSEIDKSGYFCEVTLFCGKDIHNGNYKIFKLIAQKNI